MLNLFKRKRVRDYIIEDDKSVNRSEEIIDNLPNSETPEFDKSLPEDDVSGEIEKLPVIEEIDSIDSLDGEEAVNPSADNASSFDVLESEEGLVPSDISIEEVEINKIDKKQFIKESILTESSFELKDDNSLSEIKTEIESDIELFTDEVNIDVENKTQKPSLFSKLKQSLEKTKNSLFSKLNNIFSSEVIDEDLLDELEEALYTSDIGVKTTELIIENIRKRIKEEKTEDPKLLKTLISEEIVKLVKCDDNLVDGKFDKKPYVILVVGVNGNGKTTTIGKLAHYYKKIGKKVLIGAADTFRAAAIEQLETWAKRAGAEFVKNQMNSDPAAVAYNAYEAAVARDCDVVLIDTAGRLHNKVNLMKELEKITKVLTKLNEESPHEVLLVLDATTGQNAVSQARNFNLSSGVTGLVLTKLDGTAKGGVAIAINQELDIPIKFIGIGEKIDDIKIFDPKEYVKAIFD